MREVPTEFLEVFFAPHLSLSLSGRRAMPEQFYNVRIVFAIQSAGCFCDGVEGVAARGIPR
jgi:hypothetical protein